ncbi:MAG: hypothetical protein AAB927_02315 [Patescibacteria group bacterium]
MSKVLTQGLACSYAGVNPSFAGVDCSTKIERARPSELRPMTDTVKEFARTLRERGPRMASYGIIAQASRLEF